jgi:S1-C subfamily serine protease
MKGSDLMAGGFALLLCSSVSLFSQFPETLSTDQIVDKAYPSVALVLAGRGPGQSANSLGAAVVVRPNGILLTAYHVIKDAYSLQVRFKTGEVFDQVQLLGVDTRRDVAAIRITAAALPVLPHRDRSPGEGGRRRGCSLAPGIAAVVGFDRRCFCIPPCG